MRSDEALRYISGRAYSRGGGTRFNWTMTDVAAVKAILAEREQLLATIRRLTAVGPSVDNPVDNLVELGKTASGG